MALTNGQKFGIAALSLATVFTAVAPAAALDVKCGYSPAEISAAMKAEGQKPLLIGDKIASAANNPIQIFTSDKNGNGYILEGNQPSSKNSTSFCVALKVSDVRLYDARKEIPASAFRGGRLDEALRQGQRNGERVFLQANAVNNNGQVTNGTVTVGGTYNDGGGALISARNLSDIKVLAGYTGLKYSNEALAVLNNPVPTVSVSPN